MAEPDTGIDENDRVVERGWRVLGWICVALGVGTLAAGVARSVNLVPGHWWDPFVLVSLGVSVVLLGLALALPESGDKLTPLVLAAWGVTLVLWGMISLTMPDQVLVSGRRGPDTPGTARVFGVLSLGVGAAFFPVALSRARRARTRPR